MTIAVEITDEAAQRLSDLLSDAKSSVDSLDNFSGSMPFDLGDFGVDTDAISGAISIVSSLFSGKLPEPKNEDDIDDNT